MKKILVIGGGAMGSAFTIPCLENNNRVIITEPYSKILPCGVTEDKVTTLKNCKNQNYKDFKNRLIENFIKNFQN